MTNIKVLNIKNTAGKSDRFHPGWINQSPLCLWQCWLLNFLGRIVVGIDPKCKISDWTFLVKSHPALNTSEKICIKHNWRQPIHCLNIHSLTLQERFGIHKQFFKSFEKVFCSTSLNEWVEIIILYIIQGVSKKTEF